MARREKFYYTIHIFDHQQIDTDHFLIWNSLINHLNALELLTTRHLFCMHHEAALATSAKYML